MKKPNFFILGGSKCGTTSLHYYLSQQEKIFLSKVKEPHFFDSKENFSKGHDFYLNQHFKSADKFAAVGEATPAYLCTDSVIPRMLEFSFDEAPRFVVILRNPVYRALSHYLHVKRNGKEELEFLDAIRGEEERLRVNSGAWVGYVSEGLYAKHLTRWFDAFGKENFKCFINEDLDQNPLSVVQDILQFLGIDDTAQIKDLSRKNQLSQPRSEFIMQLISHPPTWLTNIARYIMPSRFRKKLRVDLRRINLKKIEYTEKHLLTDAEYSYIYSKFRDDIALLENILERDLSCWESRNK